MTVDGVDCGSATSAPTCLTCSHATWDTAKTVGLWVVGQLEIPAPLRRQAGRPRVRCPLLRS